MERKLREIASMLSRIALEVTFMVNEGKEENVAGIDVKLWNYDAVVAGYIELAGEYFFSPELVKLHGEIVRVEGFECDDVVNVFDLDDNFICRAEIAEIPEKVKEDKEKRKSQLPLLLSEFLYDSVPESQQPKTILSPEEEKRRQRELEAYRKICEEAQALSDTRKAERRYKSEDEGKTSLPSPVSSSKKEDGKKCKHLNLEEFQAFHRALEAVASAQTQEETYKSRDIFLNLLLIPLIQLYLGVSPLPEVLGKLNQFCQKALSSSYKDFNKTSKKEV